MTRAILYCRVSTEEQEHNNSLPTQLQACRRYAEQQGWSVVAELHDALSGALLDRPGLSKLRQVVAAGGVDAVIVYSQDRLTRSVAHMLLLRDELNAAGVALHAVTRGASQDTPEGRLFDTIEASFAEYERLRIAERARRGKRGKLESGKILGQGAVPPYGYQFAGSGRDKALVIDDQEAAVIRQIVAWYLDGVSIMEMMRRLDAAGIAPPSATRAVSEKHFARGGDSRRGSWSRSMLYKMVRTRLYIGEYRSVAHDMTVAIPAILDEATWQAVQRQLDVGRRRSPRNAKRTYLLRSRLTCGRCGHAVVGHAQPRPDGTDKRYYLCGSHPTENAIACQKRPVYHADAIEGAIWEWIVTDVLHEAHIIAAVECQRAGLVEQRQHLEAERAAYVRQIEAADGQIAKLVQLFTADVLSIDEVAEQKRLIVAAKESAQTELARVDRALQATGPDQNDVQAVLELARQMRAKLDAGVTDATKARVIDLLDVRGVIDRDDTTGQRWVDVCCRLTGDSRLVSFVSTHF